VRDEVVVAYLKSGLRNEAAKATGADMNLVRQLLSEAGVLRPTQAWRVAHRSSVTARDAVGILRAASEALGGRVTMREYRALALERVRADGQPWPKSEKTLIRVLRTQNWNEALQKAGIPAQRSAGRRPRSLEPCLQIIRFLTRRLGGPPGIAEYDEMASSQGVILSQALETHFGWRWGNVLTAAGVEMEPGDQMRCRRRNVNGPSGLARGTIR
jgi:hypothetical protein